MKFLKTVFASCLGVLLFSFFSLMILFSLLSGSSAPEVEDGSVLLVSLDGMIVDRKDNSLFDNLSRSNDMTTGLDDIVYAIRQAKDDEKIKGICLKTNAVDAGFATMEEIRDALSDFKLSRKFIYAYSGLYTQGSYYVASIADSVYLNPQGAVNYSGISTSSLFCRDLLEKVGVNMQVVKAGAYKSYAESYVGDSLSPENKEQLSALIGSIWNVILDNISSSRGIDKETLASLADSIIPLRPASYLMENGFVDRLIYGDEFRSLLKSRLGLDEKDDLPVVSVSEYVAYMEENFDAASENQPEVAVVYLDGEIDNGSVGGINSTKTVNLLLDLKKDTSVKAIVLRINSPGGSAYGSEQICHVVEKIKKDIPVVASMGDYAASGGYYIASNASAIVSNRNTITGSIGVIALIPNAKELADKIGVHYESVKTNANADVMENLFRPLTPVEQVAMQRSVDDFYQTFVLRCAEGRSMTVDEIKSCAEGRVWSGVDAKEKKLVDQYGTLQDAVSLAANLAALTEYEVSDYPEKKDFWQQMEEIPSIGYEKLKEYEVFSKEKFIFEKIRGLDKVQAIIPYTIELR